jgi:hypothetical protein
MSISRQEFERRYSGIRELMKKQERKDSVKLIWLELSDI